MLLGLESQRIAFAKMVTELYYKLGEKLKVPSSKRSPYYKNALKPLSESRLDSSVIFAMFLLLGF